MLPSLEFFVDFAQLVPHPFRDRGPLHLEGPAPSLAAYVREAQEVKGLRSAEAPCLSLLGGMPPELDQSRFLSLQLQGELREPLAQVCLEPLRVFPMLKPGKEVIRVPHDDHVSVGMAASPLLGPLVLPATLDERGRSL